METYLADRITQTLHPLTTKISLLSRLVDQLIFNVDKHEDQVDIIEQALFGKSRAQN